MEPSVREFICLKMCNNFIVYLSLRVEKVVKIFYDRRYSFAWLEYPSDDANTQMSLENKEPSKSPN